jgi:hypothetical protein
MWWRRDPSLFSRSLIHRLAQRVPREDEAALRTRGYSRAPHNSAQREQDDGDGKRPAHLSTLEWMQLQHYERWRKRVEEDPYKTLFGASNNMLNGKGLGDWDWIHRKFPKWMLNEMGVNESAQPQFQERSQEFSKYPKKVDIQDHSDVAPRAREPFAPESSSRKSAFEREASSGVVSPSDLRRPQDDSHVRVVGRASSGVDGMSPATSEPRSIVRAQATRMFRHRDPPNTAHHPGMSSRLQEETQASTDNASDESKTWRQTALQRRTVSEVAADPPSQSTTPLVPVESKTSHNEESVPRSPPQSAESVLEEVSVKTSNQNINWLLQQQSNIQSNPNTAQNDAASLRPSSEKLKKLPQDDLDFLSAADIRASMGAKRSRIPTDEQKQAERQNLERAFVTSKETPDIDSMLQASIINNQYVRRTEREMRSAQVDQNAQPAEPVAQSPVSDVSSESSIDRMMKWLETTGASFANQFWQNPTEEADVTKTKLFFDKVAQYVKKGQAATKQIADDLEKDIPASKSLLKRLKRDEEQLDMAIHRLRRRTSSGQKHGLSPGKIRDMEALKTRFHQTNSELEKAYGALTALVGTESVTNATGSFKRRLTTASKVLHKNSQLLRMLIWSLQTRLEDPKIDRDILPNYKVVADNLLSLRDTQMTLMRLVDRAMLVYGVVPNAAESTDAFTTEQYAGLENCDDPFVRARLAADAHLIKEINAHKSTVQEPSHDPSSSSTSPTTSSSLYEPSPLAHSLFRPFGPAIDKLGNKEERDFVPEDERTMEVKNESVRVNKMQDNLKEEPAYMNNFDSAGRELPDGVPATANVEPNPNVSKTMQEPESELSRKFDMLKEDGVSLGYVAPAASDAPMPPMVEETEAVISKPASKTPEKQEPAESSTPASISPTENRPTHYTIIIRDPQTDTLSITTSTSGPPRDTSPSVPLHQALSTLDSPAKFIPHLTSGLEIVSANRDILVLRDALSTAIPPRFETIRTSASDGMDMATNPIDGTTRLSPTGYVGPEESQEQLEKEFQARREAASSMNANVFEQPREKREEAKKEKKRGGAGGVVKTAIWVAGMCYVVGVVGEIYTPSV